MSALALVVGKLGMAAALIWAFFAADKWFWFWNMDWKNLHSVDSVITPGSVLVYSAALITLVYPFAYRYVTKFSSFPLFPYALFVASALYFVAGVHSYWHLTWGVPGTTVFVSPIGSGWHFILSFGVMNALAVALGIWGGSDDDDD
jgi:hypothetical protein